MIRLIQFLIFGHYHKWLILTKDILEYSGEFGAGKCDRYVLQCEKCGKIKVKDAK